MAHEGAINYMHDIYAWEWINWNDFVGKPRKNFKIMKWPKCSNLKLFKVWSTT